MEGFAPKPIEVMRRGLNQDKWVSYLYLIQERLEYKLSLL
jgi:hypothetical protein